MHTLFFILSAMAVAYSIMQCWWLLMLKHFGHWNEQIRLAEHGILFFMHKEPPIIAMLCLLAGLLTYARW